MARATAFQSTGIAACLALTGCCLPPIIPQHAQPVQDTYGQEFVAHGFISRVVVRPAAVPTAAESLAPLADELRSNLPAGARLIVAGPEPSSLISFRGPTGEYIFWIEHGNVDMSSGLPKVGAPGSAWDQAHREATLLRAYFSTRTFRRLSVSGIFTEPNLLVRTPYFPERTCRTTNAILGDETAVVGEAPSKYWPVDASGSLEWHLKRTGLLDLVQNQISEDQQKAVRVGHLDTGYDPDQITLPKNTDHTYEANLLTLQFGRFSAVDPGLPAWNWFLSLCNNTHGTGTLSILAGNIVKIDASSNIWHLASDGPMGAAPYVQIVPIRIADSVVHLYSDTLGKAIWYASESAHVDVISLSAGGLPSQFWADAVNRAYESGVVIAAAASDSIHGLPTRQVAWPARFRRTIAAAGATATDKPYDYKHSLEPNGWFLEGSYGPPSVMKHAVAAYAPNTPWARWGEPDGKNAVHRIIDLDGGGTSAATPQVAGAAALYLAKYGTHFASGWKRAQTVKAAILDSATETPDFSLEFGRGLLNATQMILLDPQSKQFKPEDLDEEPEDTICFPAVLAILGITSCDNDEDRMHALEIAQLLASDPRYEAADWDNVSARTEGFDLNAAREFLLRDPRASRSLVDRLKHG